mmetsp:Transcript_8391/g.37512  ORF Transcript_8391/g.37512 Transcript_8391/m.37512 type:complete len:138 (+) Transcript_8391:1796-2209(+)
MSCFSAAGITPSTVTFNSLALSCHKSDDAKHAAAVLDEVDKVTSLDRKTCRALVSVFLSNDRTDQVIRLCEMASEAPPFFQNKLLVIVIEQSVEYNRVDLARHVYKSFSNGEAISSLLRPKVRSVITGDGRQRRLDC